MGFDKGLDQCIIEAVDRLKDEMIDSILELVRIDSVEGKGQGGAFWPGREAGSFKRAGYQQASGL